MRLQYKLQNGSWVDADAGQAERMVANVLQRETWFAPRVGRSPMTSAAEVEAFLAGGKTLRHGDDWYDDLRDGDAVKPRPAPAAPRLTRCDCGHETAYPMAASLGTACPACYDSLSD